MRSVAFYFICILPILPTLAQSTAFGDSKNNTGSLVAPERGFSGDLDIPVSDSTYTPPATAALSEDTSAVAPKPTPVSRKSDIETTINYTARDSMLFDIESQRIFLFGKSHIDYGATNLDAERTSIDWENRTLQANYVLDTTGRKIGKPVFSEGSEVYETDEITYNFQNKRALIKGVVTEQNGAFMHGEDVKKNENDELFIKGAKYSTCNLADPHFFIESDKIKVVPGNKVLSGPFNMKFREIPTPLWFPFGMFPQPRSQAEGILFPSYGEEKQRGFFLREMGYYFAFNDYMDLRLTGDVYSKGAHALNATSNYIKRYRYSGTFNFSYNKNLTDDIENPIQTNDYWVRWNHRPQSRGNASFSASVSAGTSTYNANNNLALQNFNRSINSQFTSNVGYTQRFRGTPFNMAINARHSQNLATGITNLSLPDFSLNMNRIYPLKNVISNPKSPLAKLSFSHNFVAKNELTNNKVTLPAYILDEGTQLDSIVKFTPSNFDLLYDRAKIGGRHSIPLSTSFTLAKFFTVSPSINYQEVWYTRELKYSFIEEENGVRIDTVNKFSRAGSWSSGASVNTRFYGTHFFNGKNIQAIRHVVTPSVSFSYSPDFGAEKYGVWQMVQTDTLGTMRRLSKYEGFAYGSPNGSKSKTLGFSLTNNLEMKVRDKKDSVNEFKKVKIFDNLSMSTGYNFAADSFRLSTINWNTRTSFFKNALSVALNGTLDPYVYKFLSETTNNAGDRVVTQRRLDQYTWNNGQGLGNLSRLNTSVNFRIAPKKKNQKETDEEEDPYNSITPNGLNEPGSFYDDQAISDSPYGTEEEKQFALQNPDLYVDFNMPWSLNVQYSINRSQEGYRPAVITQTMSFNGSVALTSKTQVTFRSGWDFEAKEVTNTSLSVSRDLHCWSLNFGWVPFGRLQSFNLTIQPKSSMLQDLKLEKRRNFLDFFNN